LPNGEGVGIFEPDFETGTEIQFMLRDAEKMIESAKKNSKELIDQIKADGNKAYFGLYIDCAGRTSAYSNTITEEASEIQTVFNRHNLPLFGFYSGVEVAPLLQKSRGLDWTGVLVVLAGEKDDG
jgi:small ligand-binding sensory domain FIST